MKGWSDASGHPSTTYAETSVSAVGDPDIANDPEALRSALQEACMCGVDSKTLRSGIAPSTLRRRLQGYWTDKGAGLTVSAPTTLLRLPVLQTEE